MATAQMFLKSPTGLRARTLGPTSFSLTWTPSPTSGAMYNVLLWVNMNGWVKVSGPTGLSGSSTTVTGLQPSSTYKAQIQAYLPNTKRTALSNTVTNINTQRVQNKRGSSYTPVSWINNPDAPTQIGSGGEGGVGTVPSGDPANPYPGSDEDEQ